MIDVLVGPLLQALRLVLREGSPSWRSRSSADSSTACNRFPSCTPIPFFCACSKRRIALGAVRFTRSHHGLRASFSEHKTSQRQRLRQRAHSMRFTRRTGIRTRGARAVRTPNVTAPAPNPVPSSQRSALLPRKLLSPPVAARSRMLLHVVFCGKHVFENNKNGLRQNILTPTAILFLFRGLRAERRVRAATTTGALMSYQIVTDSACNLTEETDRRIRARDSTP